MKTYYGNYLGIVISGGEKDPAGRGRCQVFIPHIMPALYEGWNQENKDLSFDIVGNGLPTSLDPNIVERLKKILPWAECAAPIVGASPSTKDGSEEIRNVGTSIIGGLSPVVTLGGSPETNAKFAALTNAAAQNSFRGGLCGTAVGEILEDVYGYTDAQIRAGSSTGRRDGKEYNKILQNLGWQPVKISSPSEAPPNSVISYGAVPGNQWGHVEWVGVNSSGQKAYYFGLGGANGVSSPGGGSRVSARNLQGFQGVAWVPPPEVTNSALSKFGQSPINPSALTGNVGVNQTQPDVKQNDYESKTSSSINTSNMSADFKAQYDRAYNALEGSKFIGTVPKDGATYGITTGSREEWAHMFTRLASTESSFNPNTAADINGKRQGNLTSFGLYQMGQTQFNRHGSGNIYNPNDNTNSFVRYAEELYFGNTYRSGGQNVIGGKSGGQWLGIAAAYGPIRNITQGKPDQNQKQLLAENMSSAEKQAGDYTANALIGNQQSIHTTTPHPRNDGPDTNYQALGMFGYASEGTAVWVFFREGNPLFPVYFAASYGQKEWQNMYSYSSPGIGAGVGGPIPGTEKMRMNSYGGGFESAQVSSNNGAGLDPEFTFQVYGKNGSNLLFTKDHTEFNSTYNHNQRISGDFHEITEANKETRVRGDKNTFVEQDVYVTIGNWTEEAIAASDEIQQYINEAMEIKSRVT